MWFLTLLSWFGLLLQLIFVTVSLAAGLYYLAEVVEEYTVIAGRVIRWCIFVVLGVYGGLFLFEELPALMLSCGAFAQLVHLLLMRSFPFVQLTSAAFIASCAFLVLNHYFAFVHFASQYYPFSEVLAYFSICLWLVPFALLVSLSANDNVLPTHLENRPLFSDDNDVVTSYFSRKGQRQGLLSLFHAARDSILPQRSKKSF